MSGTITKGNDQAGAIFSECETYRYNLWRIWDFNKPRACFVMLNPSQATESILDPTVSRCKKRAEMMGYGGLEVVNLFALRSTDPQALYDSAEAGINPIGEGNGHAMRMAAHYSAIVICGWGTHGGLLDMGLLAKDLLLKYYPKKIHYLKLNSDGSPAHPLYLPYSLKPVAWVN